MILEKNPKLPMAKVMALIGSLWKEFWAMNPFKEDIAKAKKAERKQEEKNAVSAGLYLKEYLLNYFLLKSLGFFLCKFTYI